MLRERVPDLVAIQAQTGGHEPIFIVECHVLLLRAVAGQQFGNFRVPQAHCMFVQAALRKPWVPFRRCVRIRAMHQTPLCQFEIVFLHRDAEMPARSRAVASLIEHVPFRIVPIGAAPGLHGELVHQFHPPQDFSVKVDVVDHLPVVGLGAALQQQAHQLVAVWMRRTVLLAFADHADQGSIPAVAGHEVSVRICAAIEQQARDCTALFVRPAPAAGA